MIDEIYKGYTITGSEEIGIVAVDPHGHFSPKSYNTYDEAIKAIDEDIENSVEIVSKENENMMNFTEMSKRELQRFGAEQFTSLTGLDCANYRVIPLEASPEKFFYRVGSLYITVTAPCNAPNNRIFRYISHENGEEYIMF